MTKKLANTNIIIIFVKVFETNQLPLKNTKMKTYEELRNETSEMYIITANTKHKQNGVIQYYNEYLGFVDNKDKATCYDEYKDATEAAEKGFENDKFEGRVIVENLLTGEEIVIINNI